MRLGLLVRPEIPFDLVWEVEAGRVTPQAQAVLVVPVVPLEAVVVGEEPVHLLPVLAAQAAWAKLEFILTDNVL